MVARWNDPGYPIPIEYSPDAIERIRLAAVDGLLALPRFGMGIGGFLLGTNDGCRITLLDSTPIECAHAMGPSFALTSQEVEDARRLIARQTAPRVVVGWYCSKTRGAVSLTPADQDLYRSLCPEFWQIGLVLKPSTVSPTRTALFFRDRAGQFALGTERDLEPWDSVPAPTPVPIPVPIPVPTPAPTQVPLIERSEPVPEKQLFESIGPPPLDGNRVKSWLAVLAICAACAVAFLLKDSLLPRPPLRLEATDSNGRLTIRWNRDAVQGVNRASMSVNDGGQLMTISLDNRQLEAGMMQYDRKSERVTATMRAGEGKAITSFFGDKPPDR